MKKRCIPSLPAPKGRYLACTSGDESDLMDALANSQLTVVLYISSCVVSQNIRCTGGMSAVCWWYVG